MLDCEVCLKKDVCGKKNTISELIQNLNLNRDFQTLDGLVDVEISCLQFKE